MAPVKVPKNTLKSMEKPVEKPISKKSKNKKRNYLSFAIYIYKVMKAIVPQNFRLSRKSMLILNDMVNDLLDKLALEAGRLVAHGKKTTMSSREIQSAVRFLLPGELAKHANMEGIKAVRLHHNAVAKKDTA